MLRNFNADTERIEALRLRLSKIITDISALESPKDKNLPLAAVQELTKFQTVLDELLLKDDKSLLNYVTQIFWIIKKQVNSLSRIFKDLTWDQKRLELQDLFMDFLKFLKEKF